MNADSDRTKRKHFASEHPAPPPQAYFRDLTLDGLIAYHTHRIKIQNRPGIQTVLIVNCLAEEAMFIALSLPEATVMAISAIDLTLEGETEFRKRNQVNKLVFDPRDFSELDARSLNEKFDLIVCNHQLESVTDPHKALWHVRALLSVHGIVILHVPSRYARADLEELRKIVHLMGVPESGNSPEERVWILEQQLAALAAQEQILPAVRRLAEKYSARLQNRADRSAAAWELLHPLYRTYTFEEITKEIHKAGLHFIEFYRCSVWNPRNCCPAGSGAELTPECARGFMDSAASPELSFYLQKHKPRPKQRQHNRFDGDGSAWRVRWRKLEVSPADEVNFKRLTPVLRTTEDGRGVLEIGHEKMTLTGFCRNPDLGLQLIDQTDRSHNLADLYGRAVERCAHRPPWEEFIDEINSLIDAGLLVPEYLVRPEVTPEQDPQLGS